ncbi:TM2 domain-containing protein [Streptococcus parauberis]|uniref:TM2 domain-containing protein n=1 Tax=Streptococcus parauberis TaxID=1348 RepID=A0AAE4HY10_9STRE|nr:TM2 domain-containing protein [Streptococcus parauberis]
MNPVDHLTERKSSSKSKVVAGVLALLLGSLGIHWFYLGFTSRAVIRLIIWLIVFWTGFGFVIMAIWALLDGILLLTAKEGSKWHKDSSGLELMD